MNKPVLETKKLILDVMMNGSFICQIQMPYCPLFPVTKKQVNDFVVEKRPSLKGKAFSVEYSNATPLFRNDANVIL